MSLLQAIILGIVQGLTEFLPISSSAYFIIVPWILNWQEHSLVFDVVLHLVTLLVIYRVILAIIIIFIFFKRIKGG